MTLLCNKHEKGIKEKWIKEDWWPVDPSCLEQAYRIDNHSAECILYSPSGHPLLPLTTMITYCCTSNSLFSFCSQTISGYCNEFHIWYRSDRLRWPWGWLSDIWAVYCLQFTVWAVHWSYLWRFVSYHLGSRSVSAMQCSLDYWDCSFSSPNISTPNLCILNIGSMMLPLYCTHKEKYSMTEQPKATFFNEPQQIS